MSIAELIMQGTNRASESTAWVGDSLAKLGQNVGAVLAQREQQKQAQEMLPMFQQSMQESMKKAGEGKSGEAYSILMPFLTDPSVARNPFMMPALEAGIKMNQIAADDFLRKSQIDAYKDRYAAKTGGVGFDPQALVDTMNQDGGGDILTVDETVNPEGINPVVAGALPATLINPLNVQTQQGMGMTPRSIAAQASATGLPAVTPTGTPQTREEVDAAAAAGLPAITPTTPTAPGIGAVRGVTPENALFPDLQITEPPKNVLEKFIRFEDKFAALPFEKQKAEMDNNSILFPDQKMLADYKPSKGRGIIQLSPEASVGIPGLVGAVEIPDKYKQYIVGNVNINPSTGSRSYSLRKEVENDPEAKAALAWLQDWQNASIEVNSNPKLRDLLDKAGNDALAIDIEPIGKGELDGQNMVELSVRGNPDTKIQVFKETADQIKVLRSQTGAANVHNAKFIRLKGEEPAAKTQAPTQGGTKKLSLEEIAGGGSASAAAKPQPEKLSAGNPFAQAVSEKQTQASATTKQSIETQKTKIQDSISELENKLKILTAVGQRNPEILPDYLRRKMSAYMNATPSRNAKDYEDTKKELKKLRTELDSLREKILESSK
jgi:hypothetical protein